MIKQRFFRPGYLATAFVMLDEEKCIACWKCLNVCNHRVIGRINLPWHKHIIFINESSCTGCLKCVNICNAGALSKITKA